MRKGVNGAAENHQEQNFFSEGYLKTMLSKPTSSKLLTQRYAPSSTELEALELIVVIFARDTADH